MHVRMGNMEGHLGNVTPTHWWKSPRWTVNRIEALAMVAIIFSFFLAAFGSCRRWSNRWIVQKGFFVAQVLSLSLGTYSIGLMQSSSVKSEMYPIWTVSMFTLFGCIDPITTYNGLDYKGPLSKTVYGICLNCGYVLLMSISAISNVVCNTAIITLSAITFIKSLHRSFALVEQNKLCGMVYIQSDGEPHIFTEDERHWTIANIGTGICEADIEASTRNNNKVKWRLLSCYDAWVALCLSHKLRRYFLGLDYRVPMSLSLTDMDWKWAWKVTEIELAFVYDALFTGNPFLHYYQAKTASLWALASFAGICFVLVAVAIPGVISRRSGATSDTKVVGTTIADLAITFGILVSLALLQLMQLVRSWTSNWARAAVFGAYTRKDVENIRELDDLQRLQWGHLKVSGWMRLKALVATSTNLFDKYLWQDKISQYSMLPEPRLLAGRACVDWVQMFGLHYIWQVIWKSLSSDTNKRGGVKSDVDVQASIPDPERISPSQTKGEWISKRCVDMVHTLGLHYIWQVILELLSNDTNKRGGVKLDEDVKGSVIDFLAQIDQEYLDSNWLSSLPEEPKIRYFLPQFSAPQLLWPEDRCYRYIICVMTWHIATWYCKLAEQKSKEEDALMSKQAEVPICSYYLRKAAAAIRRPGNYFKKQKREEEGETKTRDHRRVANALSQYCVYLVKSAPELLPGPVAYTKLVYDGFVKEDKGTGIDEACDRDTILANLSDHIVFTDWSAALMDISIDNIRDFLTQNGQALAKLLLKRHPDEIWKTLALVWVQLLVYAAPCGNAEAHMRHLSQGGEFITHLWAMLYHIDIREWKVLSVHNVHDISTVEDAQRILNDDDHGLGVVVSYVESNILEMRRNDFVTASRLVDGVKFYLTSSHDVAKCLYFPESILTSSNQSILFLNKADKKITFYDFDVHGYFTQWNVTNFVYENKLASAKARAQETAPSSTQNPIPIEKQRSEVNNVYDISTIEDAQRILNDDDHGLDIVVFFLKSYKYRDDIVTVSRLVDGVEFYLTSSPAVAKCLNFPESSKLEESSSRVLFLNKADKKITFYDSSVHGIYCAWNVAQFVRKNKLASAKARAQETAPSTTHNPIPTEKQSSEGGQTVVEITEEIPTAS